MVQTGALSKSKQAAGGGQLGEGAFKGYIAREKIDREKETSNRADDYLGIAQEDLGIRKEKQRWKREDREKEDSIQTGMVDANESGGYAGVIAYLKQVDPERALKFDQGKNNLDASIMKNDVMKTTSKLHKDKAMLESYGILGKMGAAIMNAPEEDRDGMYQRWLPMFKKINPGASNSWDANAQNDVQLAIAQATPANQIFRDKDAIKKNSSGVEKLNRNIEIRERRGETEENSPGLASDLKERRRLSANSDAAEERLIEQRQKNAEHDVVTDTKRAQDLIKTQYFVDKKSTAYTDFVNDHAKTEGAKSVLAAQMKETGKIDYSSASILAYGLARIANGKGPLTKEDFEYVVKSEAGVKEHYKTFMSFLTGDKKTYSNKQVTQMVKIYDAIQLKVEGTQRRVEAGLRTNFSKYPKAKYNENISFPLQIHKQGQNEDVKKENLKNVPPQYKAMAGSAYDRGATKQEVDEVIAKLKQQSQQNLEGKK